MKQTLLLTILVLTFCLQLIGQDKSECPKLNIQGPTGQTPIGGNMDFSILLVSKLDNSKFEYKWTVSNGVAFTGQGTSTISVPTSEKMQGLEIKTTVEIKGLPIGCENTYSASGDVAQPPPYCPKSVRNVIHGNSSWKDLKRELEDLSTTIQNENGGKAVLAFSVTNSSDLNLVMNQQKKILESLKMLKIPEDNILMKIKKDKFYLITFEFIPLPKN